MTTTLVDRYVFTALRRVPEPQRADIDRELRASIEDAVEARVDAGEDRDTAVREALVELGDPVRLADRYADRKNFLIGPELFGTWRRFMTMLFVTVLPVVVVIGVVVRILEDADFGTIVGGAVTSVITVGVHLAFWTTLVFAVIERTGFGKEELRTTWTPDDLPTYEANSMARSEAAVYVVWTALLIAAIVLQQFTFTDVPVLDPAHWTFWWPYLIVVLAVRGAWAVWTHRTGLNRVSVLVNAVLAVMTTGPLVWLLATDSFLNPAFVFPSADGADVKQWITTALIIAFSAAAVWDVVAMAIQAERTRRGLPAKVTGTGGTFDYSRH